MYIVIARWIVALLIYIAIVGLILLTRPAMFFDAAGRMKQWGLKTDESQSVFSLQIVLPVLALMTYYSVAIVELATA